MMDYLSTLIKGKKLGSGVFGEVFQCTDPVHGQVAAKYFYKNNCNSPGEWAEACRKALEEAQRLKELEHPHVVKIYNALRNKNEDEFVLVMELCEEKSAADLCASNKIRIANSRNIIRDCAMGLNYVHDKNFIHRDVKPANILLKRHGGVKVGDFGFVTDNLHFGLATPYGTPIYWAPEVSVELATSRLSDVYALGVTFLHLLHGDLWFNRSGRGNILSFDSTGFTGITPDPLFLPHIPTPWRNTVKRMIHPDRTKRCASMSAAVNAISKLSTKDEWTCSVTSNLISWVLEKQQRRIRVEWQSYLTPSEGWIAWSEDLSGGRKRTLAKSDGSKTWKQNYKSLRAFFEARASR